MDNYLSKTAIKNGNTKVAVTIMETGNISLAPSS